MLQKGTSLKSPQFNLPSSLCEVCLTDVEIFAVSISRNCPVSIITVFPFFVLQLQSAKVNLFLGF